MLSPLDLADLAAILGAAPDPVFVVESSGTIVLATGHVKELLGYDGSELEGASIECLLPTTIRADHTAMRARYEAAPERRPMGRGRELWAIRKDGTRLPVDISLSPLVTARGSFTIAIVRDITARKKMEDQLRVLSFRDALTGLYNRTYFQEEVARLERGRHFPISVISADIDGLKAINDSLGHDAGDALILRAAEVLKRAVRAGDSVARIGGDEFAALLPGVDANAAAAIALRVTDEQRIDNARHPAMPLQISIGVATQATPAEELAALIRAADANMYAGRRARAAG